MSYLTLSTGQMTAIDIRVAESDWLGLYTHIAVYRSKLGDAGPYEELTGPAYDSARLPLGASKQPVVPETGKRVNVVGKSLKLATRGTQLTATFTGSDPLTYADVAAQIQAQSYGMLRSFVSDGLLVVETVGQGSNHRLEVLGGEAAPALGLTSVPPFNVSCGRDPRIPLVKGVGSYSFIDLSGASTYYYKTRFCTVGEGVSAYSRPVSSRTNAAISFANIAIGYVRLVGTDGGPVASREVLVSGGPGNIDDRLSVGGTLAAFTDQDGRAEFQLIRGSKVTVAVAGTQIVREIVVPTDPSISVFDLFGSFQQDDAFKVVVPELDVASRRAI